MSSIPNELTSVLYEIKNQGSETDHIDNIKKFAAALIETASRAQYLIETSEPYCLISRFAELPPLADVYRLPATVPQIIRREGYPGKSFEVGQSLDIYGLPRKGTSFDPDSIYTTTALTKIITLNRD